MKILVVSPSIVYGGGESYLLELEKVLQSLDCELNFLVANEILFNKLQTVNKIFRQYKSTNSAGGDFVFVINRMIASNAYDYIILNGLSEIGVYARYISHSKIIVICHSNEEWLSKRPYELGIKHLAKRIVSHKFHKNIYKLVVLNDKTLFNVEQYYSLSEKAVKLYTGIQPIVCKEICTERDDIVFGRIGRLVDGKGNENLIWAFHAVFKQFPNIRLIFAGDGEQKNQLQFLVNELNLNKVVDFVGTIPAVDFFNGVDCMVSPSLSEAFPMIILEAMSCKKPIISTNVGGVNEMLIDNLSARLVEAGDISALEQAMLEYIRYNETYISFAGRAYESYLNKFSLPSFIERWKMLLNI